MTIQELKGIQVRRDSAKGSGEKHLPNLSRRNGEVAS